MSVFQIVERYTQEDEMANLSCGGNINYLNLKLGEKVVDLGSGRGLEAIEATKLVGSYGFVWGLDITPRMIEIAKKNAQTFNLFNLEFILSPMDVLPWQDNSIDAVISNCAINHVNDKLTVYREIFRILKQGGRFVVSDIMTEQPLPKAIREDPEMIAACFGGAITIRKYEEILFDAGFKEVKVFKERSYFKNGYPMISRTFKGIKL